MANLNEHDIGQLKKDHNLTTFFETGTGLGYGLEHALEHGFDHLLSVDIMETTATQMRGKHGDKATIMQGKSAEAIQAFQCMRRAKLMDYGPVLWWLDAHFPGVDTGLSDWESSIRDHGEDEFIPMKGELEAIMGGSFESDVIIIDDAFLFRAGMIDGPVTSRVPSCAVKALGSIEAELDRFSLTHHVKQMGGETGSIEIIPKTS